MSNRVNHLTDKEENFAQFYAVEGRPSAAYRYAYPTDKSKPASVASNAQQVMNRPHVALRIYELNTIKENEFRVSVRKKKLWLQKIITVSLQTQEKDGVEMMIGDLKAAISAISELNKMDGHLAASKKEITGKDGSPIETRAMTSEEYKATRDDMLKTDDC